PRPRGCHRRIAPPDRLPWLRARVHRPPHFSAKCMSRRHNQWRSKLDVSLSGLLRESCVGDNGARLCPREPVMVDVLGNSLHHDRFYPPIKEVVSVILQSSDVVAPIDVLVGLEVITPEQLDQWRRGELPYLERGMTAGLARVGRILRVLRGHALELGLTPTPGRYSRKGKGARGRLRFSKGGEAESEAAYACHFVRQRPAKTGTGEPKA